MDKFRHDFSHLQTDKPVCLNQIPEKIIHGLYSEFSEANEIYDKLNIAYAIAELYKLDDQYLGNKSDNN